MGSARQRTRSSQWSPRLRPLPRGQEQAAGPEPRVRSDTQATQERAESVARREIVRRNIVDSAARLPHVVGRRGARGQALRGSKREQRGRAGPKSKVTSRREAGVSRRRPPKHAHRLVILSASRSRPQRPLALDADRLHRPALARQRRYRAASSSRAWTSRPLLQRRLALDAEHSRARLAPIRCRHSSSRRRSKSAWSRR